MSEPRKMVEFDRSKCERLRKRYSQAVDIMSRLPGYWEDRAKQYRESLEARDMIIPVETFVKRVAVVRYRLINATASTKDREEIAFRRCANNVGIGFGLRDFRAMRRIKLIEVKRVWVVCCEPDRRGVEVLSRWENYCMARAHADGRNFHYAKYIMTQDINKWTNELSGM